VVTLVKICGIRDLGSAQAAVDVGADLLGFHFCNSRRRISPEDARSLVAALPRHPPLVGVFINQPEDEVARVADLVGLDLVQLHGTELPGFHAPRPVIKALKVRSGTVPDAGDWPDPVLLDSWAEDQRGGTGRTWDWTLARELASSRQVIVAGGLKPDNVGEVVRLLRPHGVDVSSGVEVAVGCKDPQRLRAFVQAVREADDAID
jgi:phosphoribosylanthranilate isomerase